MTMVGVFFVVHFVIIMIICILSPEIECYLSALKPHTHNIIVILCVHLRSINVIATSSISAASRYILIAKIMSKVQIFILVGFAVASFWLANAKPCSESSSGPEESCMIAIME